MVGCVFYAIRESKGAGVNDVPVARQSRDLARPQARIPVRVTKKHSSPNGGLCFFYVCVTFCSERGTGRGRPVRGCRLRRERTLLRPSNPSGS